MEETKTIEPLGSHSLFDDIPPGAPALSEVQLFDSIPAGPPVSLSQAPIEEKSNGINEFFGNLFGKTPDQMKAEAVNVLVAAEASGTSLAEAAKNENVLKNMYEDPTWGEALKMRRDNITTKFKAADLTHKSSVAFTRAFATGDEQGIQEAIEAYQEATQMKQGEDPRIGTTEQWVARSTADLAGQLYAQIVGAKNYAVAGGAAGAAGGATAGGIGAIPGAIAGAGISGGYGMLKEIYDSSLGSQTMGKMQEGIDPKLAYFTSIPTAAAITVSERMKLSALIKHVPGVDKIFSKGVAKATKNVEKWTIGRVATETGKTGLYGSSQEAAQTIIEQLDNEITKQLSNEFNGTNISPRTAEQVVQEVKDTFMEVLPGMLVLGGIGPASSGLASTFNRTLDEKAATPPPTLDPVEETETVILDKQGQEVDVSEALPDSGDTVVDEAGDAQPSVEITPEEVLEQDVGADEAVDNIVLADDATTEALLEGVVAEASATGDRYGDFIGVVRRVLPKKQAKMVEALLKARAKATGRTKEQFAEDNQLAFRVEEDETGTVTGSVEFIQDGETIVRAFQNTNLRDVTHEIAHVFRKDMSETELSQVQEAFGVKDGKWNEEAEERFAEGFVEFLATGEAPTKGLKKIFSKFKKWLGEAYQALTGNAVNISPEMRSAYESILKGDLDAEYTSRVDRAREATHTLFSKKGIKAAKTQIREATGQTPTRTGKNVDTHVALKESLRQQVMAARKAMLVGDKKGYAQATAKFKAITERARNNSAKLKSRSKIRKAITKLIKSAKVKKRSGKPLGQFTAGFQEVADELIEIMSLPVKEAKKLALENRIQDHPEDYASDLEVLKFFLLETRANMKNMDETRLNQLHADLKEFFETGRVDRAGEIGARIAKVAEAKTTIIGSLDEIKNRKFDDPSVANAYKENTSAIKKFIDAVANFAVFDFHGFMDLLDMGNKALLGEGAAALFGETLLQENQSNTGRRVANTKLLTQFAEIFGLRDKEGNPDPKLAERRMWEEERQDKVEVGTYEIMKKDKEGNLVGTGRTRKIVRSKAELRKMWMEMQDPLVLEGYKEDGMTDEIIAAIRGHLTNEDVDFARAQLQMYNEYYDRVNEVYRKVYGTNLPKNEFYSPIVREFEKGTDMGPISDLLTDMTTTPQYVAAGSTHLKSRTSSKLMLEPQSDVSAMNNYIRQMEHFIAFAEKVQELNGVFKDKKVQQAIRDTYGDGRLKMIQAAILNIARNGKQKGDTGAVDVAMRQIRGNLARGLVGLKALATAKQLSSFYAYSEKMGTKEFMAGVWEFMQDPRKNAMELKEASEFIQNRGDTLERDIAMLTNSSEFNDILAKKIPPSFNNIVMMFVKAGDIGAIYAGGWSYYKHLRKQGMSKEDAIFEFEKMSRNTQQSSELGSQTAAQQGNEAMRLFTMFTTSQRQYMQKAALALEAKNAGKMSPEQFYKTTMIYLVALPALFQMIAQGGAEDEEDMRAMAKAVLASPLSAVPFANMASNYALSSVIQGHTYGRGIANIPLLSPTESAVKGANRLMTVDDISYSDMLKAIRDIMAVSEYAGVPGRQIGNIMIGLSDTSKGEGIQGALEIAGMSPYAAEKRVSK